MNSDQRCAAKKSGICTVVFVVMYACKIMFACNVGWLIFIGYITCELTPFQYGCNLDFFPQGDDHVIKMESHVRHTNMVSLNRFWNMLYLTFHGFESLNSREIRLAPSSYEFLSSNDGVYSASLVLQTVYKRVDTVIQMN